MWCRIKRLAFPALCWIVTFVSAIGVWLFGAAILNVIAARSWPACECLIKNAAIETQRGNSRVKVEYEYIVGQTTYTSSRYKFLHGYTSWRKVLPAGLVSGARAKCFVDPGNPNSAVIERGMTWDMLFGLIPLLLFIICGPAAVATIFARSDLSNR